MKQGVVSGKGMLQIQSDQAKRRAFAWSSVRWHTSLASLESMTPLHCCSNECAWVGECVCGGGGGAAADESLAAALFDASEAERE